MRTAYTLALLLAGLVWVPVFAQDENQLTVDQILDSAEAHEQPPSMRAEVTQTVYQPSGRESVSKMIQWSKDRGEKSLLEYTAPQTIDGMKILMLDDGDEIWVHFPRTNRTRKLASHQRKNSVNNSDFTYEDMSMQDQREDYDISLAGEREADGRPVYVLEMKPKEKDNSYSKIVSYIDRERFIGVKAEFHDENGKLWKVMSIRNPEKHGSYWLAKEVEMKDVQKGSRTVMHMDKMETDVEVSDQKFSHRSLER